MRVFTLYFSVVDATSLNARTMLLSRCRFFFFQAEDGIRDLTVTGVQTCALPISGMFVSPFAPQTFSLDHWRDAEVQCRLAAFISGAMARCRHAAHRGTARRVGSEDRKSVV